MKIARRSRHLADTADEEAPEAAALPEAVVGGVGPEHEKQSERTTEEEMRSRMQTHRKEPDSFRVHDVPYPDHYGEERIGEELR